jgi:YqaJ-like viral recombinase domain
MIFKDVEQNSEEWFNLRVGMVTTSNFAKFMANYGKAFGDPAVKYAFKLAKEQITGEKADEESFTNAFMDAGHEWEPVAKDAYENDTFNKVSNGGFCQSEKYKNVGGSPDGLILNDKGGIEIKSVIDWTQRTTIKRNSFDPAYRWQILGNIWLCDLDYLDFISYGYNYTEEKKLFIHRVTREEYQEEIDKIEPRLIEFLELIEKEKGYL